MSQRTSVAESVISHQCKMRNVKKILLKSSKIPLEIVVCVFDRSQIWVICLKYFWFPCISSTHENWKAFLGFHLLKLLIAMIYIYLSFSSYKLFSETKHIFLEHFQGLYKFLFFLHTNSKWFRFFQEIHSYRLKLARITVYLLFNIISS